MGNEACDIEVRDNKGQAFVVEVQTTEANLHDNINKAIRAGYKRIVILATNHSAMIRIRDVLLDEENTPKGIEIEMMDWTGVPA